MKTLKWALSLFLVSWNVALLAKSNKIPRLEESLSYRTRDRIEHPVLQPSDYPGLYDFLRTGTGRLIEAVNTYPHNEKFALSATVLVVSASLKQLTASVIEMDGPEYWEERKTNDKKLLIQISTGLLEFFLGSEGDKETRAERAVAGMLGALAHEIAHHSSAYEDRVPIPNILTYESVQQIEEARADLVAIDLLRKARFPVESIYICLKALHEYQEREYDPLFASHPASQVRVAYVRQGLTLDKLNRGRSQVQKIAIDDALITDLFSLPHPAKKKAPPSTLILALKNFEESFQVYMTRPLSNRFESWPEVASAYWWLLVRLSGAENSADQADVDSERVRSAFTKFFSVPKGSDPIYNAETEPPSDTDICKALLSAKLLGEFSPQDEDNLYYFYKKARYLNPKQRAQVYMKRSLFHHSKHDGVEAHIIHNSCFGTSHRDEYMRQLLRNIAIIAADGLESFDVVGYLSKARSMRIGLAQGVIDYPLLFSVLTLKFPRDDRNDPELKAALKKIATHLWDKRIQLAGPELDQVYFHMRGAKHNDPDPIPNWGAVIDALGFDFEKASEDVAQAFITFLEMPAPSKQESVAYVFRAYAQSSWRLVDSDYTLVNNALNYKPVWAHPVLFNFLRKKSAPELVLSQFPFAPQAILKEKVFRAPDGQRDDPETLAQAFIKLNGSICCPRTGEGHELAASLLASFLSTFFQLDLTLADKHRVITTLLAKDACECMNPALSKEMSAVWPILRSQGHFVDLDDLYSYFIGMVRRGNPYARNDQENTTRFLSNLYKMIDKELAEEIRRFVKNHPSKEDFDAKFLKFFYVDEVKTDEMYDVLVESKSAAAAFYRTKKIPLPDIEWFRKLTYTGPSPATDALLGDIFDRESRGESIANLSKFASQLLERGFPVFGDALRSRILILGLRHRVTPEGGSYQLVAEEEVLKWISVLMPQKSVYRDQVLEEVSWLFEMSEDSLSSSRFDTGKKDRFGFSKYEFVSLNDMKSYQGRSSSFGGFLAVQLLNGVGMTLAALTPAEKFEWIEPFVEGGEKLTTKIRSLDLEFARYSTVSSQIQTLTPAERTPLLELLLGATNPTQTVPLVDDERYQRAIFKIASSDDDQDDRYELLSAFLRSLPAYERPLFAAYYLAHARQYGGGIKSLFEIFTIVGIKTGQMAAVWKIFQSPEVQHQIEGLKDRVPAMEKAEIYEILRQVIPQDTNESKIRELTKLLGSASIKTVVKASLGNRRRETAYMIKRPYAEEKVTENLLRARAFLSELKKNERFVDIAESVETLVDTVEKELEEELDFEIEKSKVAEAFRLFDSTQTSSAYGDWKIRVPRILGVYSATDRSGRKLDVEEIELADGIPWSEVKNQAALKEAGSTIVTASLDVLFNHGFINADPHKGNFLISADDRTVYFLDFGQSEQLTGGCDGTVDERAILAKFLLAYGSGQFEKMLAASLDFATSVPPNIHANFPALPDGFSIAQFVNKAQKSGIKFKKKFLGVLKGLAILQGEQYVNDAQFKPLITRHVLQHGGFNFWQSPCSK